MNQSKEKLRISSLSKYVNKQVNIVLVNSKRADIENCNLRSVFMITTLSSERILRFCERETTERYSALPTLQEATMAYISNSSKRASHWWRCVMIQTSQLQGSNVVYCSFMLQPKQRAKRQPFKHSLMWPSSPLQIWRHVCRSIMIIIWCDIH